jgi:integrase
MPVVKLTAAAIPRLPPKDEHREEVYRDSEVRGLLLEVHPSGRRTFVAWGYLKGGGHAVRMTLGVWQRDVYDLKDARDDAKEVLRLLAKGTDPRAAKKAAKVAGTFGALAESFLADAQIRPATRTSWEALLRHERLAGLRARPTTEVTRAELVHLFERIRKASLAEGKKGYSANRTMEAVRRVFSWAAEKAILSASPCVGMKKPTKEQPRRRSYTDAELGAVVRALRTDTSPMAGAALLALHTGVRIETALGAPWSEFDLDKAEWAIAANRTGTKNGLPWLVPLTAPAVALLRARANGSAWVFSSRSRAGDSIRAPRDQKSILRLRRHEGVPADFRPHDLRRTLNSWLASRAGNAEPLEVRDAILGHAKRGLEQSYNTHDYYQEKRDALERWAAHVERIGAQEPARVIAMPGRA